MDGSRIFIPINCYHLIAFYIHSSYSKKLSFISSVTISLAFLLCRCLDIDIVDLSHVQYFCSDK